MRVYKLWFYFCASLKKIMLLTIYGSQLSIGNNVTWRRRFNVMIDKAGKIEIGRDCFFNNDCSLNANHLIVIGNGTLFGENVRIYDHNHRFREKNVSIKSQGFSNGEVYIGKHCWIGSNVVILKGANISDNCVIGAGVVVDGFVTEGMIVKSSSEVVQIPIKND